MKTTPLMRFLDLNGNGTGTNNAVGNYSTPDDFYVEPPSNQDFLIKRLVIHIADANIIAGNYGDLTALTNGVRLKFVLDGVTYWADGGVPIKTNAQWGSLCYDVDQKSWAASPTQESLLVRYTFAKFMIDGVTGEDGVLLQGHRDDKFVATMQDNLTGLDIHRFMAQGTQILDGVSASNAS
jgi:hypothetical protein